MINAIKINKTREKNGYGMYYILQESNGRSGCFQYQYMGSTATGAYSIPRTA